MKAKQALIQGTVAAALATPALLHADTSTVTIYGVMNVSFENVRAEGATPAGPLPAGSVGATPTGVNSPSRNRVTSNASNIGFRGVEELGRGVRALFQVESTISMDGTVASPFATRNSGVGLSSDKLGTLIYGIWETPYLLNNGYIDPFYFVVIASPRAIIGKPGYAGLTVTGSGRLGTTADASFDRRQGNSVQYWTPNFNGLAARLAYSANEDRTATINPYIWSVSVAYGPPHSTRLPLYINLAYERHNDYFGLSGIGVGAPVSATNSSSRDWGAKATLGYTFFGTTLLGLTYERLMYRNSDRIAGNANEYERDAWAVTLRHQIGPGTIRASYARGEDADCRRVGGGTCNAGETGARQWSAGYSHSLSRRTDVFAYYTHISNDNFQNYQFALTNPLPQAPGTTSKGGGLGIRHAF